MSAPDSPTKVLLVGAGALGSVYAWRLDVSSKIQVTTVCRSNYETVKENGFHIISHAFGDEVYRPHRVVRTIDEAVADGDVYDFVIVCTKALPNLGDTSSIIAPAVRDPRTIIMLIQNGIGIEDPYAARYPNNPIVSTIAYIDASQPTDGTIDHGNFAPTYDVDSAMARVKDLCQVWGDHGVVYKFSEDIQKARWAKLMLANPECKALIRSMMVEVYKAGEAVTGGKLPALNGRSGPDQVIEDTETRAVTVIPSMLMDFRGKRPMEHAVILRNPIELAKKHGVEVPHLETVYALLTMVEKGYLQ
ncbi:ApbA-domain-containing protein [Linderina pennispora]|uniref:ApbA-domain-containing protein n=1 Tax=Linderina pennispora TaxID=61395 RepID=A0A1Y1VVT5_9FUNG|nr:ApbA-domain-containing protein [Linderina pennispora]ORX65106.1 ApbA-domain-containing protein [Linderina pennispora]